MYNECSSEQLYFLGNRQGLLLFVGSVPFLTLLEGVLQILFQMLVQWALIILLCKLIRLICSFITVVFCRLEIVVSKNCCDLAFLSSSDKSSNVRYIDRRNTGSFKTLVAFRHWWFKSSFSHCCEHGI